MRAQSINKKVSSLGACLMAVLLFFLYFNYEEKVENGIVVGVPDDAASLVFHYLSNQVANSVKIKMDFNTYPIRDCCSSVGEWALSSERLHMAVICADAADRLLETDPRFVLLGPVLKNSDIIVLHPGAEPKKIGVTHNRWYQEKIVAHNFGPDCETVPMLPAALPYAFYKNEVDGVVVDITKGLYLEGDYLPGKSGDEEQVTYVLVGRKDILETSQVKKMLDLYADAVDELQELSLLQSALTNFDANLNTGKEGRVWESMGIKLISPQTKEKK